MRRITVIVVTCSAVAACGRMDGPTEPTSTGTVAFSAGQSRAAICHYDETADAFIPITVAEPSLDAHLAHGDVIPGAGLSDHSAMFDSNCEAVSVALSGSPYATSTYGGSGGSRRTPRKRRTPSTALYAGPVVFGGRAEQVGGRR